MNRSLQFLQSETPIGTVGHTESNACEESVSRHHAAVLVAARIPQALAVGVSILPIIVIHPVQMLSGRAEVDVCQDADEGNDEDFFPHDLSPSGSVLPGFSIADQDAI